MAVDLFTPVVNEAEQHPIFKMLISGQYDPERDVLIDWAAGFDDRDGKFVKEFQSTFESSMWELYINKMLRHIGLPIDLSHHAPDFYISGDNPFSLEATVARPEIDGSPPIGLDALSHIPQDFNDFNRMSSLRLCNSIGSKIQKYRNHYHTLSHVQGRPFVVAVAPFDRPMSHMSCLRPIFLTLFGVIADEELTISLGLDQVVTGHVLDIEKKPGSTVPVGLFTDDRAADISAVIYSSQVTWGKIRAMAYNPGAPTIFTTYHPNPNSIEPIVRKSLKAGYIEHLLDGVSVFHNPHARTPLETSLLNHERTANFYPANWGTLHEDMPTDFLLMRQLHSVVPEGTVSLHLGRSRT